MAGCNSCATSEGNIAAGCKNNGGCATGGCNKLNVFDWLSDMDLPKTESFEVVEVRFKNGKKEFFKNNDNLDLVTGDAVVVDVPNGHHLGHVSLQGELVRLQMRKKNVELNEEVRNVYRKATLKDLEKYNEVRKRENPTLFRTREIIRDLKLEMKLTDIEFQADNTKATFYYSADDRVDFRELIKLLASEFRIRVEMRQISLRQEAGRLGGIGSCGRELCCSTWLSDFKSVSTTAARYQNLSLNPGKLSGQCGRLKCCLNYELETYMDALKGIPELEAPLKTSNGNATLTKTDIFRKIMWFAYAGENSWIPLKVERVKEIIELNKNGEIPESLDFNEAEVEEAAMNINSDLERLDKKYKNKNKKKRGNRSGNKRNRPNGDKPGNKSGNLSKRVKTDGQPSNDDQPKRNKRRFKGKKEGEQKQNQNQPQNQSNKSAKSPSSGPSKNTAKKRESKRQNVVDNANAPTAENKKSGKRNFNRKRKPDNK